MIHINENFRKVTIYRDDSTVQIVYNHVKHIFWTANNSVLVIAQYLEPGKPEHRYVHWPRERFCWFKDEKDVKSNHEEEAHDESTARKRK